MVAQGKRLSQSNTQHASDPDTEVSGRFIWKNRPDGMGFLKTELNQKTVCK